MYHAFAHAQTIRASPSSALNDVVVILTKINLHDRHQCINLFCKSRGSRLPTTPTKFHEMDVNTSTCSASKLFINLSAYDFQCFAYFFKLHNNYALNLQNFSNFYQYLCSKFGIKCWQIHNTCELLVVVFILQFNW